MQEVDLSRCPLFAGLSETEIQELIEFGVEETRTLKKNEYLARQGEEIKYLYLLIKGVVRTEMITKEGNLLEIEFIDAVRPLAPAFMFAHENRFPVDVIAMETCTFLLIPKALWLKRMMANETLLQHFLQLNSNMIVFLSKKLQMVSMKSLKGKLSLYILENTTPEKNYFILKRNRTQLAEYFGVQRPSLARTMSELIDAGIISIEKRKITVNNRMALNKMV